MPTRKRAARPKAAPQATPESRAIARREVGFVGQPWDRQPRESEPVYQSFLHYRDMPGKRTLVRTAAERGVSALSIERASRRWGWRARLLAWDAHQRGMSDADLPAKRVIATAEHQHVAQKLRTEAARLLTPPERVWRDGHWHPVTEEARAEWRVSPAALTAATLALDKAVHHERLALGMPTDITRQDVVVREQLKEAQEVNGAILGLIGGLLCDECRIKVVNELERLARRHAGVEAAIEAAATPTG